MSRTLALSENSSRRPRAAVPAGGGASAPLVAYLVLAPGDLSPDDLFPAHLTVHRADAARGAPAIPLPSAPPPPHRPERPSPVLSVPPDPARGLHVDTDRRTASVDGRPLELTYLEFELLAHLVAHPHRVHTRARLVEAVWGYAHVGDGRTVDVHVARLRRKLGPAHRRSIATVRRVGYKYVPAD